MYPIPDQARIKFALNALQRIQTQCCPDRWNSNLCLEDYVISIAAFGMRKKRYINTQENSLSSIADGHVRYMFLVSVAARTQADINSTKYWSKIRSGPVYNLHAVPLRLSRCKASRTDGPLATVWRTMWST